MNTAYSFDDVSASGTKTMVSSWEGLMNAVNNAANGDEIELTGPIINTENMDRIKLVGKTITIDLQGNTVDRKRTSSHADGHVFEVTKGSVLTIKDSKGGSVITGGWANNGGAINIDSTSKCVIDGDITIIGNKAEIDGGGAKITSHTVFNADGVTISDNTAKTEEGGGVKNQGTTTLANCTITGNSAKKLGGGVFNDDDDGSEGDMTIESCTISDNHTDSNGGGVYSDKKLRIKDSTITGNNANDRGCGVFIGGDSEPTDIEGTIIVQDNDQSNNGQEVYLRKGRILNLTGPLGEGTMIGITIQDDHGTFTQNYKTYHKDIKPDKFFFSPENLEMDFAGTGVDTGEIYLGWASMLWTKDCEFSFSNEKNIGFYKSKYKMLDSDFEKMCRYLEKTNNQYYKGSIIREMNKDWHGACYRMSASVILNYTGQIAFNENLDPYKDTMYKVLQLDGNDAPEYFPVRLDRVNSAIHYYQLSQLTSHERIVNTNYFASGFGIRYYHC